MVEGCAVSAVAWQVVRCAGCGKEYRCTPDSDYYNNTNTTDGVCETCLLMDAGIHPDNVLEMEDADD
jgi:hypothetical protein